MNRRSTTAPAILLLAILGGCGSAEPADRPAELAPYETFVWTDRAITFRPPPWSWDREHETDDGRLGVRFRARGSTGRISIAESAKVDPEDYIEFTLDAVVGDLRERVQDPSKYTFEELAETEVDGLPARRLDFTVLDHGRAFTGCEIYFISEERAFIASFLGDEKNQPVFERLVTTIAIPSDFEYEARELSLPDAPAGEHSITLGEHSITITVPDGCRIREQSGHVSLHDGRLNVLIQHIDSSSSQDAEPEQRLSQAGFGEVEQIWRRSDGQIDEQVVTLFDTWDSRSHRNRARYAVLPDGDHTIVAVLRYRGEQRPDPRFEQLVASMRIGPAAEPR